MNQSHLIQCPECKSRHVSKNGLNKGKQNYICVDCKRQLISDYNSQKGYDDEFKRECLKMYVNGMGFRAIERVKVATLLPFDGRRNVPLPSAGVHHTTIMNWVKQVGELLPDAYEPDVIPEVGELDELEMRSALARRHPSFPAVKRRELRGVEDLNSIQVNGRAFVSSKKTKYGSGRRLTTSVKES